jgi:hypothetical protein
MTSTQSCYINSFLNFYHFLFSHCNRLSGKRASIACEHRVYGSREAVAEPDEISNLPFNQIVQKNWSFIILSRQLSSSPALGHLLGLNTCTLLRAVYGQKLGLVGDLLAGPRRVLYFINFARYNSPAHSMLYRQSHSMLPLNRATSHSGLGPALLQLL